MFFLRKKDGMQRMVIDARGPHAMHRRPPSTELSTPGSLASLNLAADPNDPDGAHDYFASSVDLVDSFYQFEDEDLASWFGCPWGETAAIWGVTHIVESSGADPVPVQRNEVLYFCFRGMPMGWTWALHFCQQSMLSAVAKAIPTGADGFGGVILDGRPAPRVRRGAPIGAVYVDNSLVIASSEQECHATMEAVLNELRHVGLEFHTLEAPTKEISFVGLDLNLRTLVLRNTEKRAWRLYASCRALLSVGGATSWAIEVFV